MRRDGFFETNNSISWDGKEFGVSNREDSRDVAEFWVSRVLIDGRMVRLVHACPPAWDLGVRLWADVKPIPTTTRVSNVQIKVDNDLVENSAVKQFVASIQHDAQLQANPFGKLIDSSPLDDRYSMIVQRPDGHDSINTFPKLVELGDSYVMQNLSQEQSEETGAMNLQADTIRNRIFTSAAMHVVMSVYRSLQKNNKVSKVAYSNIGLSYTVPTIANNYDLSNCKRVEEKLGLLPWNQNKIQQVSNNMASGNFNGPLVFIASSDTILSDLLDNRIDMRNMKFNFLSKEAPYLGLNPVYDKFGNLWILAGELHRDKSGNERGLTECGSKMIRTYRVGKKVLSEEIPSLIHEQYAFDSNSVMFSGKQGAKLFIKVKLDKTREKITFSAKMMVGVIVINPLGIVRVLTEIPDYKQGWNISE